MEGPLALHDILLVVGINTKFSYAHTKGKKNKGNGELRKWDVRNDPYLYGDWE